MTTEPERQSITSDESNDTLGLLAGDNSQGTARDGISRRNYHETLIEKTL